MKRWRSLIRMMRARKVVEEEITVTHKGDESPKSGKRRDNGSHKDDERPKSGKRRDNVTHKDDESPISGKR
jgi:hypothetical protein